MKVILLDNIKGVGHIGDIRTVSDGYARNYLFPHKLAKLATKGIEKEAEALQKKRGILLEQEQKRAAEAQTKLNGLTVEVAERANDLGTLFAALGKKELIKKIRESSGVELTVDMIDLPEPIKTTGEHTIALELSPELKAEIRVVVKPE